MARTLKQLKEHLESLLKEVTIDNDTGRIEDDNSSPNKNLQKTPKNMKSARQQPNMGNQKQLPPPQNQQKALANPSRIPVVIPSSNVPANLQPKPTTPAVQDKKPGEKYMGKIYPEKKPVEPNKEKPEDKKPEEKPVEPNKEKPVEPKPSTPDSKISAAKPKPTQVVKKKDSPIVKTGEADSKINLDLRGSRTGVGMRYSGPEHLLKAPTKPR